MTSRNSSPFELDGGIRLIPLFATSFTILTELIQERERISQAIAALESVSGTGGSRRATGRRRGRTLSAAAIANIRRAQRARRKREQTATARRRTMSAEAIEKIRRAKKKWWKAKKAAM